MFFVPKSLVNYPIVIYWIFYSILIWEKAYIFTNLHTYLYQYNESLFHLPSEYHAVLNTVGKNPYTYLLSLWRVSNKNYCLPIMIFSTIINTINISNIKLVEFLWKKKQEKRKKGYWKERISNYFVTILLAA
jgi:hypothetical protein